MTSQKIFKKSIKIDSTNIIIKNTKKNTRTEKNDQLPNQIIKKV